MKEKQYENILNNETKKDIKNDNSILNNKTENNLDIDDNFENYKNDREISHENKERLDNINTITPIDISNDENKNLAKNILAQIKEDFIDSFNNLPSIKDKLKKLQKKEIIFISFIWLFWITNLSIYASKNLSILFFSNVNNKILLFTFFLGSLFMIIETMNIIKRKSSYLYVYIIFWGYFLLLFLILCKSLLYSKGWGWQFYLMIILTNLNIIIFSKFNITYEQVKLKNE